MRRDVEVDVIGTAVKRDETADLPMFAEPRPVASVQVVGAKQAAREAIAPHLTKLEARVLTAIVAHGPCTRDTLAEVLAMNPNTVRPRCKALLDLKRIIVTGYTTDSPRRELLAVAPTLEDG